MWSRRRVCSPKQEPFISPSAQIPAVSVIIVNFNAGDWLEQCVRSLEEQTLADFEVLIIDNGSKDGSIAALPELDARFKIIELGENTGFAAANNFGAKQARADWIALLNPDAFARPDWLENLLGETRRSPDIKMVGSSAIYGAGAGHSGRRRR